MPSNKTIIIAIVFVGLSAWGYFYLNQPADHHGHHEHKSHPIGMTAKLSAGVDVTFEMITENPTYNSKIEVIANITSITYSGEFEYEVFMPHNSTLHSPASPGKISLEKGVTQQMRLIFEQSMDYDMKVHLNLKKPGSPNTSMFTFSTLNFHQNQTDVEELQERQSKYAK